jgi:hypothetical protein
MPFVFGTLNVLGKVVQDYTKINDLFRYLLISITSALVLIFIITYNNIYNYSTLEWNIHYIMVFIFYITAFTCIMNTLEKLVLNKKWENYEIKFVSILSFLFFGCFFYIVYFQE